MAEKKTKWVIRFGDDQLCPGEQFPPQRHELGWPRSWIHGMAEPRFSPHCWGCHNPSEKMGYWHLRPPTSWQHPPTPPAPRIRVLLPPVKGSESPSASALQGNGN